MPAYELARRQKICHNFFNHFKICSSSDKDNYLKRACKLVIGNSNNRQEKKAATTLTWTENVYAQKYGKYRMQNPRVPCGNHYNQTASKTTVSLYLSRNVVGQACKHKLNLSRIMEQALKGILDYLEAENAEKLREPAQSFSAKPLF